MTGAYSFVCTYGTTDALLARLNALGGWTWRQGDSHWYGDYLACNPADDIRIRICDFPTRKPGPDGEDEWEYQADIASWTAPTPVREANGGKRALAIDAAFRDVLSRIPAHDVKEIEWFD